MSKKQMIDEASKSAKNMADLIKRLSEIGATDGEKTRAVHRFLSNKAWKTDTPLRGQFELTPLCNLDCKMCYVHLEKEQLQGQELLTVEEWKKIMKDAVGAGMMYATLTGGECLTYPGFKELYLYLHSLGVQVTLLTNGVLIKEDMVEFFKKHPPRSIQMTLYGSSEDAYECVTGHRKFKSAMETIRLIKDANLNLKISVTPSIFMKDTEDVIRLLHDEKLKYSISPGLEDPNEETGRSGKRLDLDQERYIDFYKLKAELDGIELIPGNEDELPPAIPLEDSCIGLLCGAGRNSFVINYKGAMLPCTIFEEKKEYPLKEGFEKSWNKINEFVKTYPRPVECEACKMQSVCTQCVVKHQQHAPIGHASKKVCEWGRMLLKEGLVNPLAK